MKSQETRTGGRFVARERGAFDDSGEWKQFVPKHRHDPMSLAQRLNERSIETLRNILDRLGLELRAA
jgi:hypothetical protein